MGRGGREKEGEEREGERGGEEKEGVPFFHRMMLATLYTHQYKSWAEKFPTYLPPGADLASQHLLYIAVETIHSYRQK
jgi:hypothetical protein